MIFSSQHYAVLVLLRKRKGTEDLPGMGFDDLPGMGFDDPPVMGFDNPPVMGFDNPPVIGYKKELEEEGKSHKPNEIPEVEAYQLRAYPGTKVPESATLAARAGWATLNAGVHSGSAWQLIGQSKATDPSVLPPSLSDGAQSVASGRVTAMAISPTCNAGACPIYVGAAGGGLWKAKDALSGSPGWEFISGSFGTSAIGSLLMDSKDASGNTLYAGTGEPNSGVSEAGVGIFKTTNGGQSWTLVTGSDIFFGRSIGQMAFDKNGNLLVPVALGVFGISSIVNGISSNYPGPAPLGLYRQTAATFTLIRGTVTSSFPLGSTTVKVDPWNPDVIYVNEFSRGIWRSNDNGVNWNQIKPPLNPAKSSDRAEFDVAKLPNNKTRMYVGVGNSGHDVARFYQTNDAAAGAVTFQDMTTAQNIGYCTFQCWYDNVVYTPPEAPDVVYLGGSFSYDELNVTLKGPSNGRALLLSTDGGGTFSDLTQDGDPNPAEAIHPYQHAIVTVPGKPLQFVMGSDAGVMRSDGKFVDVSGKCETRGLNATDTARCKSLLNRVPNQLVPMNTSLSTLHSQSLSVSAQQSSSRLQGGTQDNGTLKYQSSSVVGGQSGFKVTNDKIRFNTFSGQLNAANFQNGDPTKWVIISAPIVSSSEGSLFLPPIIADPNPATAGSIFQGSFSVWRTQDWGGDPAYLEANCPDFSTPANKTGCGNFVPIGGSPSTQLTSSSWGGRSGGAVAWLTRASQDIGSLWAATTTGRVFITKNANDAAASVIWNRVDRSVLPDRAITQISLDPIDSNHAWISYNGYNMNTPTTPGHVFEVTWSGSGLLTGVDLSYNMPDMPVTALVRDDPTGDLYAASDFGVMKLPKGTTTWVIAGSGMPMAAVTGLTIEHSARILNATQEHSSWSLQLPAVIKP